MLELNTNLILLNFLFCNFNRSSSGNTTLLLYLVKSEIVLNCVIFGEFTDEKWKETIRK